MQKKSIRDGICNNIGEYAKADNKHMKDYDKKEFMHLNYYDVNNLYGWKMSQKLSLGGFKLVENRSQFNKDVPENYNEDSDERYFLKFKVLYLEILA